MTSAQQTEISRSRWRETLNRSSNAVILGVLILVTAGFVLFRWLIAAHRELSRFVVAGSTWVNPRRAPHSLYVFPHSTGYDGQFYWRLAVAPTDFHRAPSHGASVDALFRFSRVLYSWTSYAVSLGHISLVPLALVLVNVVALIGLGALGVYATRSADLSPWWGLTLTLIPGALGALSRDLTDLLATTLVVAGVLAMRQLRWGWAALAWSGAVLTRETALAVVAAYAGYGVFGFFRRRRPAMLTNLAWVIPIVVAAGWQLVLRHSTGTFPVLSSANNNVGPPFVGLVRSVTHWFTGGTHGLVKGALIALQVFAGLILIGAAVANRKVRFPAELLACVVTAIVVLCGTSYVWPQFDLRNTTDAMALAWLVVLERVKVRELRLLVMLIGPVVGLTMLWRIAVI